MSSKSSIIVTGGAGYIGSHTVIELFKKGFNPIIVDNLCNSSMLNIEGINTLLSTSIKWYNVDCTNYSSMSKIFQQERDICSCIHFAAFKSVEESVNNPDKYFKNNIESLRVLLKCMVDNHINKIIFSSSCSVYGNPDYLPVDENTLFKKPESPYAETKQICENIIAEHNCSSISLRYFNPIGYHSSNLIGDRSKDKPSNILPVISEVALGFKEEFVINGNSYNTVDGTCLRDYIHVEDLALSHVKALDYLNNNKSVKLALNVGTGKPFSILELIKVYEKINNVTINTKFGEKRKGDVEQIFSDNKLIKKILKWYPLKSLKDAVRSEYQWKLNNV